VNPQGHKLAGAAQRRTKQGCLHQGSILIPQSIPPILLDLLPTFLADCLGDNPTDSLLSTAELILADSLEKERYATREWNFSR
jgi:lipoate-protein ligase A